MKTELRRDILAETYEDVKQLIFRTVWDFYEIHGGCVDDLISQANLIFIFSFDDYDSSKGTKFTTWLVFKIKRGLIDYLRKKGTHEVHLLVDDKYPETYLIADESFSAMEFFDELGQDASVVMRLFLEIPRDVMVSIFNRYVCAYHARAAVRNRLQNRLRQMGWTMCRIKEAFKQLKETTSY